MESDGSAGAGSESTAPTESQLAGMTVVILARDAELTIESCLGSIGPGMQVLVALDDRSTDRRSPKGDTRSRRKLARTMRSRLAKRGSLS